MELVKLFLELIALIIVICLVLHLIGLAFQIIKPFWYLLIAFPFWSIRYNSFSKAWEMTKEML